MQLNGFLLVYHQHSFWSGITRSRPASVFSPPIVAPMVAVWLDLNEILSVIENLGRMGAPVPEWLSKFITVLKNKVDVAGEIISEDEDLK